MTMTWKFLGAGALALALGACGQKQDSFTDATPDVAGLSLELAGGAPEGLAAAEPGATPGAAGVAYAVAPSPPAAGDELGEARAALKALNAEVRRVLEKVAEVAQQPPSAELGDLKIYGPVVRCVQQDAGGACQAEASLRLAIRHHYLRVYSWTLEARPAASVDPTAFKPVLAGWMARAAEAHRGRGRAAFNLENLRLAAPGYTGRGYLLAGFGHVGEARRLAYKLIGFTPDATLQDPVTAGFVGHRTPGGLHRVRVATFADVVAGANPAPREVELSHLAWQAGVGGRGFMVVSDWTDGLGVTHGDVGAGQYFLGRGCWGAGGALEFKDWRLCTRGAGLAACLASDPVQSQPAGATWEASCTAPATPAPADGSTAAGAEQGTFEEPATGLDLPPAAEPPPATQDDTAPPAGP